RQHVLARDEQRGLAQVLEVELEVKAPANMPARAKQLDEPALAVDQAGVAFRHDERVVNVDEDDGGAGDENNSDARVEQGDDVHSFFRSVVLWERWRPAGESLTFRFLETRRRDASAPGKVRDR